MNIFQKIINNKEEYNIVYESANCIVINDIFPKAKFHFLVITKKNYINLQDFLNLSNQEEQNDFFNTIKTFLNKLSHAKVQFNCGKESGQEIMHLHAHIFGE